MDHPRQFKLTEAHIRLVCAFIIDWDDSYAGAPFISPRSPYGYGPGPEGVAKIAGVDLKTEVEHCESANRLVERHDNRAQKSAYQLHQETATALQICLATRSFEPGTYRHTGRTQNSWEKIS